MVGGGEGVIKLVNSMGGRHLAKTNISSAADGRTLAAPLCRGIEFVVEELYNSLIFDSL